MGILMISICGLLFFLGGREWGKKQFRRIGVPLTLALFLALKLKCWWLFLACGAGYGLTIPIGYGEPTPDDDKPSFLGRLLRVGWLIRGVYGLIVAATGALWLVLGGFMPMWAYIVYIAINFSIGALLCKFKAPDFVIEPLVGAGFALIVFFI